MPHDDNALPEILILALGIVLAVGAIATIALVSVVVIRRQRKKKRRDQDDDNVAGKGKA